MKHKLLKTIWQQGLILCISLFVAFLIGEIYCRAALAPMRYGFPKDMYVSDDNPNIKFRMAPDFEGEVATTAFHYIIKTNSEGFRANLLVEEGKPTIGIFGDSFAFGQGVNEENTFSNVLYDNLGGTYNVINFGTCSYKPMQEYQIYKQQIEAGSHFDVVVLQLYTNDLKIQEKEVDEQVIDGRIYKETPPEGMKGHTIAFLAKNSEFFLRLYLMKNASKGKSSSNLRYVSKDFSENFNAQLASTKALLKQWKAEAETVGSTFIVFFIPDRIQVEPSWVAELDKPGNNLNAPSQWLQTWEQQDSSFNYLHITDDFRMALKDPNTQLYFELNGHCNEAGNKLIGDLLADYIKKKTPHQE